MPKHPLNIRTEMLELIIGIILMFTGWIIVFLIVLGILPQNLLLTLLAYAISLLGLLLGSYGATVIIATRRRKEAKDPGILEAILI